MRIRGVTTTHIGVVPHTQEYAVQDRASVGDVAFALVVGNIDFVGDEVVVRLVGPGQGMDDNLHTQVSAVIVPGVGTGQVLEHHLYIVGGFPGALLDWLKGRGPFPIGHRVVGVGHIVESAHLGAQGKVTTPEVVVVGATAGPVVPVGTISPVTAQISIVGDMVPCLAHRDVGGGIFSHLLGRGCWGVQILSVHQQRK